MFALHSATAALGQPCLSWDMVPRAVVALRHFVFDLGEGQMRVGAMAVGMCAAFFVAGCSVGGSNSAAKPTLTHDQLFDPCTIPDNVIASTGVRQETKNTKPLGIEFHSWRGCAWHNDRWDLSLLVASKPLSELRTNPAFRDIKPLDLAGRHNAIIFNQGDPPYACIVSFETRVGTAEIMIQQTGGAPSAGDLCAIAVDSTHTLDQFIPR